MIKVDFYDLNTIEEDKLGFAVIMARYNNKWIYAKHKQRDTWEIPGGHRENLEKIEACAFRELVEETGADKFKLTPLCIYSVDKDGVKDFGQIFCAEVENLNKLPDSEIERIEFFDNIPDNLTYPLIQPFIFKKALEILKQ
ncbi:MAG: NUDIX domain-containing protein [Candidatus Paceibacterota bacterium]